MDQIPEALLELAENSLLAVAQHGRVVHLVPIFRKYVPGFEEAYCGMIRFVSKSKFSTRALSQMPYSFCSNCLTYLSAHQIFLQESLDAFKQRRACDEFLGIETQDEIYLKVKYLMSSNPIQFQRGPYGEIFPPPFLSHVTPDEAWKRYYAFNLSIGVKLSGPQSEAEKPLWYNYAAVYCHQIRLREVIGGTAPDETPEETALRVQVAEQGERLSIRPIGMEHRVPKTYAPVIRRLDENAWQFGLPEQGRNQVIEAQAGEIIEKAQLLYVQWQREEKTAQNF